MWLVGSSLIRWAGVRANDKNQSNLGLDRNVAEIKWYGTSGMHWTDLAIKLQELLIFNRSPRMIVIHVGGNDIVSQSIIDVEHLMEADFANLFGTVKKTLIVWSDILPRRHWRGTEDNTKVAKALDLKRKRVNRIARREVLKNRRGRFVIHDEITRHVDGGIGRDGTHLTEEGYDKFLNSFRHAIETFLASDSAKCVKSPA